jgi:hypothetical protein
MSIKLGDEVVDTISGFTGIAIARHEYLNGCVRISLQPKCPEGEMKLPDTATFDEPNLRVVQKDVVAESSKDVGGPDKYVDRGRVQDQRK